MKKIENRIAAIKKQIMVLGPIHPGRIRPQYNICGTAGCRCKDPKNPRKHGPYHNLSYTFQKKGKTLFIPKDNVREMRKRTERYLRLKELVVELVEASVLLAQTEVFGKKDQEGKK